MALNLGGDRGWTPRTTFDPDKARASITGRNLGGDRGWSPRPQKKKKPNLGGDRGWSPRQDSAQRARQQAKQIKKQNNQASKAWARQQRQAERIFEQQQKSWAEQLKAIQKAVGKAPTFKVPKPPKAKKPKKQKTKKYPKTPLPIPPEVLAMLAQRESAATLGVDEAKNAQQLGIGEVESSFQRFLRDLTKSTEESKDAVMGEATARNLAFQPAFVNPRFRDIRESQSTATADATAGKTEQLAALQAAVDAAMRAKQETLALNTREKATWQTQLDKLVGI